MCHKKGYKLYTSVRVLVVTVLSGYPVSHDQLNPTITLLTLNSHDTHVQESSLLTLSTYQIWVTTTVLAVVIKV